ncbi:sporulation protein YtxC [Virgibacillus sp. W0181]|uniref:sporulation protein YtxC n=1 Tax=Virgibacillus sp. W0181 TaxID=3391581 RepID=UPI003F47D377
MFKNIKHIELNWKTDKDWGNHIQFKDNISNYKSAIAESMVHVFFVFRLSNMIKQVIQECFFYTNIYEIERISDIAHGALSGEDPELLKVIDVRQNPERTLYSLFNANLQEVKEIHFDSIVKFQLKSFKEQLVYYVGIAIDEFKREEDHQTFVNMLREYVQNKKKSVKEIHLVQGNHFTFYKTDGRQISQMELRTIMQKEPLYMVGLDVNEMNLAPLITMAPEVIYIYGDNPSDPKTLTIINVFQERVRFRSIHQFPFKRSAREE